MERFERGGAGGGRAGGGSNIILLHFKTLKQTELPRGGKKLFEGTLDAWCDGYHMAISTTCSQMLA